MNELCVQPVEHCTAVMSYSCALQHGRITKQQQPQKQVTEVCVCVCEIFHLHKAQKHARSISLSL
ncbi:hypothetical protein H8957_006291, partial [Semnopithecus entellus]